MSAIYKKELFTYFTSMIGYIFLGFFILITGFYFVAINVFGGYPIYTETLVASIMLFLFLVPVLTMRLFADEARQKTDRLLYTAPVSIAQIVMAKFFAAFSMFLIGVAVTLLFPLTLSLYGDVPVFQTICGFVGYILLGGCFIAVGLFAAVLTTSQVIAAVTAFAALFFLFVMEGLASLAPANAVASLVFAGLAVCLLAAFFYHATRHYLPSVLVILLGAALIGGLYAYDPALFDGFIYKALSWLSVSSRYQSFASGILKISDVVYYITFSIAFIYLTVNVIEKRRWR